MKSGQGIGHQSNGEIYYSNVEILSRIENRGREHWLEMGLTLTL